MSNVELYRAFRHLNADQQQEILDWLDAMLAQPACTCDVDQYLRDNILVRA